MLTWLFNKLKLNSESADNDLIGDFKQISLGAAAAAKAKSLITSEFKNFELLILSSVTCLLKIVQNMSNFLSPFLKRLVYTSCSLSYLTKTAGADVTTSHTATSGANAGLSQIDIKLGQLRQMLATLIPLRLLAPILAEQSSVFLTDSAKSIVEYNMKIKHVEFYMHVARMAVKNAGQEDLLANIRTLKTLFMNLFNMRAGFNQSNRKLLLLQKSSLTSVASSKKAAVAGGKKQAVVVSSGTDLDGFVTKELCKYENHSINAFCELTFKLSEDLFRPMFFGLYEWATANDGDYSAKDRLLTFYRVTYKLSDKLKNLFVLFAAQFVQNAAAVLNNLNPSKSG
jgi:U3 small nucleolar RNA-associated protein 10